MPVILAIVVAVLMLGIEKIYYHFSYTALGLFSGFLLGLFLKHRKEIKALHQRLDEHREKILELVHKLKTQETPASPETKPVSEAPALNTSAAATIETAVTAEGSTSTEPTPTLNLELPDEAPATLVLEPEVTTSKAPLKLTLTQDRPSETATTPVEDTGSLPGPIRWLLQGNPVAKIGVLLLFFGLAYLFKFATDHDMLPIELRLGMAAALAGGLLTIGWKLRSKKPLFGLLLQGAASGCWYLTIFAAFRLYGLLPQELAFGLMIVVCAASVMLAILQQAQSLAVAASLGGFLAPLLLSTGSGN